MSGYAIVGGCVAPAEFAPVLEQLQRETGCAYASIYRGEDAAALLHSLTPPKHTQAEIYQQYLSGQEPNPANPPGRSTHETRSDGVAYPGPVGRQLAWWQCGIDVDDAHADAFTAAAGRHGWVVIQPYHSGSEFHHRNFTRQPGPITNWFLPLQVGSVGLFVWILNRRLKNCGYRPSDSVRFGDLTSQAVRAFQSHHRLQVDGVVGPITWENLKAAERSCLQHHTREV